MKENTEAKLIDDDNESERLLNNNNNNNIINTNINTNINIINTNKPINAYIPGVKKKQILVPTHNVITISIKGKMPERIIDKTIFCYKRREWPKKLNKLNGFMLTLFFFIFFSIIFTICLLLSINSNDI